MPVKSKPFYWIECDHEGCDARCPDPGFDEVAAWQDADQARDYAVDGDWRLVDRPAARSLWMCQDHKLEYCERCGTHLGPLAGEQDYICERGCPQAITARSAP